MDAELRDLLREAETANDAVSWIRCAQGLARAARFDEAAHVSVRAIDRGASPGERTALLDSIAPDVEALTTRRLGKPGERPVAGPCAFSPKGDRVYVAEEGGRLVVWEIESGEVEVVAWIGSRITALAVEASGERVAIGCAEGSPVRLLDLSKKTLTDAAPGAIAPPRALALLRDHVIGDHAGNVLAWPIGDKTATRSDWRLEAAHSAVSLDPSGAIACVRGRPWDGVLPSLELFDPFAARPRATVQVTRLHEVFGRAAPGREELSFQLAAAGTRAVVSGPGRGPHLVIGESGETLLAFEARSFRNEERAWALAPSPTGRIAARLFRGRWSDDATTGVQLLDPGRGLARSLRIAVRLRFSPVWSPSGRRLALPAEDGTVTLIEAP